MNEKIQETEKKITNRLRLPDPLSSLPAGRGRVWSP